MGYVMADRMPLAVRAKPYPSYCEETEVRRVCVFDVNETCWTGRPGSPLHAGVGDAGMRQAWFGQLLESALTSTVTGADADFAIIGQAALQTTAERAGSSSATATRPRSPGRIPTGRLDQLDRAGGPRPARARRPHHAVRAGAVGRHRPPAQAGVLLVTRWWDRLIAQLQPLIGEFRTPP
jgi:hypothetical protein